MDFLVVSRLTSVAEEHGYDKEGLIVAISEGTS